MDNYLLRLRASIDKARGLFEEGDRTFLADDEGQKISDGPVIYREGITLMVDLSPLLEAR